jgi:hypothetical protein
MTFAGTPVARRARTITKLAVKGALALSLLASATTSFAAGLKERPMAAPAAQVSKARAINSRWLELYLPEKEYNAITVKELVRYTLTSVDDASFAGGIKPIVAQNRHWPETAPYADYKVSDTGEIRVAYRVFLKTPAAATLKIGKTYTLTVDGGVGAGIGGQYTFKFSSTAPNESIHVNQAAYLASGPKTAYMSGWTGEGTVSFDGASTFSLINVSTGATVYSGNVVLDVDAATEVWSKSNVYSMDFSAFTTEGTYRIYVPTVGSSFQFKISSSAFNDIGYTVVRGLTMQRDGNHGLDSPLVTGWHRRRTSTTRWSRAPASRWTSSAGTWTRATGASTSTTWPTCRRRCSRPRSSSRTRSRPSASRSRSPSRRTASRTSSTRRSTSSISSTRRCGTRPRRGRCRST